MQPKNDRDLLALLIDQIKTPKARRMKWKIKKKCRNYNVTGLEKLESVSWRDLTLIIAYQK